MPVLRSLQDLEGKQEELLWATIIVAHSGQESPGSISDHVPLLCGIQLLRTRLITEILCHHQAVNAAVHDPYADASEVWLQNVSAMSG